MLTPQLCASSPVNILDVLIQEWKLIQLQHDENSCNHLTDAKQGGDDPSDSDQLRPTSYPLHDAAWSWNRVLLWL